MDYERSARSKARQPRQRGNTHNTTTTTNNLESSSDESTISTTPARLRSGKRKSTSLRKDRSSQDPSRLLPGARARPWPLSSDSSQPTSPEIIRPFSANGPRLSTRHVETAPSTREEEGLRNIINFEDDARSQRGSHEPKRASRTSLDSERRSIRLSDERPSSKYAHDRRSTYTVPETAGEHESHLLPSRRKLTKIRHESLNSDATTSQLARLEQSHGEDEEGRPVPIVDPRKMLQLMRTTRGRMQGMLFHKEAGDSVWSESHCFIDADSGCLCRSASIEFGDAGTVCLMKDLRKCAAKALLHSESRYIVLHLTAVNGIDTLHLRPTDPSYFNAWFAAFLCWSSVQIGQRLADRREQQRPNLIRQISNFLPAVDPGPIVKPIRKVGAAVLVEVDETKPVQPPQQGLLIQRTTWTPISCLLNAKGELRLLSKDLKFLATVHLSELPRSAIQRLGPSVLGADSIIALYPQYAQSTTACTRLRPIYLSFESKELFEVWFVLLRAHAVPELYGTSRMQATASSIDVGILPGLEPPSTPMLFRIERSLHIRMNEAKIWGKRSGDDEKSYAKKLPPANYYVEVLLDGQVKAKSTVQFNSSEPIWFEQFDFYDFATALSSITIRVKRQERQPPLDDVATMSAAPIPGIPPPNLLHHRQKPADSTSATPFVPCGEALIETSMLSSGVDVESWYSLTDDIGNTVGEVSVKVRQEEDTVLMDREYDAIFDLLHNFSSALTLQIYERIPLELGRLSMCLLNIFQVSGQAAEWLMSLAEEEVDGVREPPPGRSRVTHRLNSSESRESLLGASGNREDVVRELNKSATQEANLLFRGNTLLSKALDFHMRRVGRTYLDETVGPILRQIAIDDIECEVDPSRLTPGHDIQKSWRRLLTLTESLWDRIQHSASKCPAELRTIFRHIRACADDRYGDYMRLVTYSSVSGFLFLRFFSPAVLNPHLFGLLNVSPGARSQRTYILIAKSLNGLASMTTFGSKEPWMKHMNGFLSRNRQNFKSFIDEICNIPSDEPLNTLPTSYSIPIMIFQKLPLSSREGFPSLPHLIDRARNLAALVDVWLEGLKDPSNEPLGHAATGAKPSNSLTGDLARFHDACLRLRQRTRAAWHSADRSERVPSGLTHKWVAIAERMESAPEDFWGVHKAPGTGATSTGLTPSPKPRSAGAAPKQGDRRKSKEKGTFGMRSPSARRSKTPQPATLAPPALAASTTTTTTTGSVKRRSGESVPRRPVSSSQPSVRGDTTRTVASAAQLTGTSAAADPGLAFSSAPPSEDEMGVGGSSKPFALRVQEQQQKRNVSAEGVAERVEESGGGGAGERQVVRRTRDPYIDLTLTAETLHGRALGLGMDRKRVEEGVVTPERSGKEKKNFWGRIRGGRSSEPEGEGE